MPDTAVVIGIAGHAKSGKSTLGNALAERLGISAASFGHEVRRVAAERNTAVYPVAADRETLMRLGEELVSSSHKDFCRRVLARAGWMPGMPLIVEGIRHRVIVHDLRELVAPARFFLVLVDAAPAEREKRLAEDSDGRLTLVAMDAHSTEREVDDHVRSEAQLVVDGTMTVEENVSRIIATLGLAG